MEIYMNAVYDISKCELLRVNTEGADKGKNPKDDLEFENKQIIVTEIIGEEIMCADGRVFDLIDFIENAKFVSQSMDDLSSVAQEFKNTTVPPPYEAIEDLYKKNNGPITAQATEAPKTSDNQHVSRTNAPGDSTAAKPLINVDDLLELESIDAIKNRINELDGAAKILKLELDVYDIVSKNDKVCAHLIEVAYRK